MFSRPYAWFILAVLVVFAIIGWTVYQRSVDDPVPVASQSQPANESEVIGSDKRTDSQIDAESEANLLQRINNLQQDNESLIQENQALKTLNQNLEVNPQNTELQTYLLAAVLALNEKLNQIQDPSGDSNTNEQLQTSETDLTTEQLDVVFLKIQSLLDEVQQLNVENMGLNQAIGEANSNIEQLTAEIAAKSGEAETPAMSSTDASEATEADMTSSVTAEISETSDGEVTSFTSTDSSETTGGDLASSASSDTSETSEAAAELNDPESMQTKEELLANIAYLKQEMSEIIEQKEQLQRATYSELVELTAQLEEGESSLQAMSEQLEKTEYRRSELDTRLRYASKHLRRLRSDERLTETEVKMLLDSIAALEQDLNLTLAEKDRAISDLQSAMYVIDLKSDVLFDSGSAQLKSEGKQALTEIVERFNDYPQRVVSVEGHTDNVLISHRLAPVFPSNWELSSARAASAAKFLMQEGLPADKVRIVGHGDLKPIASNETEEGRALNRRIEIQLFPKLEVKPSE